MPLLHSYIEHRVRRIPREQRELEDLDFARLARYIDTGARVFVLFAPLELQRGMGGRNLSLPTDEIGEDLLHIGPGQRDRTNFENLSFRVTCCGRDAEAHRGRIALGRVEQELGEFGGLAETQRKQTRRERVERSGMPCLFRIERALRALQCGVRGQPGRFVQQQHAVDTPADAPGARRLSGHDPCSSFLSALIASSINCEIRIPDSMESS